MNFMQYKLVGIRQVKAQICTHFGLLLDVLILKILTERELYPRLNNYKLF